MSCVSPAGERLHCAPATTQSRTSDFLVDDDQEQFEGLTQLRLTVRDYRWCEAMRDVGAVILDYPQFPTSEFSSERYNSCSWAATGQGEGWMYMRRGVAVGIMCCRLWCSSITPASPCAEEGLRTHGVKALILDIPIFTTIFGQFPEEQ